MQVPVQTMSQQTPCWQVPDAHSLPIVHGAPCTLRPHTPELHTFPPEQSAVVRQLTRQVPDVPHMYALQETGAPVTQTPAPSQRPGAVPVDPVTGHVGSLQIVAREYNSQPPLPSQYPSVPQVSRPLSAHWPSGSEPAGTAVQAPSLPGTAHDMQLVPQASRQQTPCWHMLELQSSPVVHAAPSGLRPQLPLVQTLPPPQSALVVQLLRQALPARESQT
jgi:hypothetical protein